MPLHQETPVILLIIIPQIRCDTNRTSGEKWIWF